MSGDGAWGLIAPQAPGPVEPRDPPTLSVIIPYYRRADVIRNAVVSALEQTLAADEIVICDDGSPDDLEGALGELCSRVKIVKKENGGFSSAMNAAAAAAEGEFVVQLDSDDVFLPRRLEAIAFAASARPDVDIIATDAVIEYEGRPLATFAGTLPFEATNQRAGILKACFFAWPAMRRSTLLAVGGLDEEYRTVADWECFVRLIFAGARVALVDEPLYRYRLTPESLLSDAIGREDEFIRGLEKALARDDLDSSERAVAKATSAQYRKQKTLHAARQAILAGGPGARGLALDVAFAGGFPLADRVKAGVAALLPSLARRVLVRSNSRRDPALMAFVQRMGVRPPR